MVGLPPTQWRFGNNGLGEAAVFNSLGNASRMVLLIRHRKGIVPMLSGVFDQFVRIGIDIDMANSVARPRQAAIKSQRPLPQLVMQQGTRCTDHPANKGAVNLLAVHRYVSRKCGGRFHNARRAIARQSNTPVSAVDIEVNVHGIITAQSFDFRGERANSIVMTGQGIIKSAGDQVSATVRGAVANRAPATVVQGIEKRGRNSELLGKLNGELLTFKLPARQRPWPTECHFRIFRYREGRCRDNGGINVNEGGRIGGGTDVIYLGSVVCLGLDDDIGLVVRGCCVSFGELHFDKRSSGKVGSSEVGECPADVNTDR